MTRDELNAIKSRLGALSPRKLEHIHACSCAAHRLISEDLPKLLEAIEAAQSPEKVFITKEHADILKNGVAATIGGLSVIEFKG